MSKNIIITGAGGNLGKAVVDKFKREGYRIIALVEPNKNRTVEGADFQYEVNVTSEDSVADFIGQYQSQHGSLDALALLVGGFAMGGIEEVTQDDFEKMITLNFFSAFHLAKGFLKLFNEQGKGTFLFVGARPALVTADGAGVMPYAFSKKLVIALAETIGQQTKGTAIRSHIFVPSIIDTPPNRQAMADADFEKWVKPSEIADTMHFAVENSALRSTTFKLYGQS